MDITAKKQRAAADVVFGDAPADLPSAFRWLDAALTWHGYHFEGDDSTGDPLALVTGFHWDTRAEDIRSTRGRPLSNRRAVAYDRNSEAAFTMIDQRHDDAYATVMDVQPCGDCGRLVRWHDEGGWRHVDPTAPECFLHGSGEPE